MALFWSLKTLTDKLEFDIYRKETNVNRFITADSNHSFQHKSASFHFLVHRLLSFPLSQPRFEKERDLIRNIAEYNGFQRTIVDNIIRKQKFKTSVKNCTSLSSDSQQPFKFVKLPFHTAIKGLSNVFNKFNFKLAYKSNHSLSNLLGNPKDEIEVNQKSGIYEICCNECNVKYIGQTRRPILTRYKEHIAHFRFNRPEKSSVARHILEKGHPMPLDSLKLIKPVENNRELDSYESIYIYKHRNNNMNADNGPIPNSILFQLFNQNPISV